MSELLTDKKDEDNAEDDDFYDDLELFLSKPTLKISPNLPESSGLNTSSSNLINNAVQVVSNNLTETSAVFVEDDLLMADIDSCLNEPEEEPALEGEVVSNAQESMEEEDASLLDSYESDSEDDMAVDMDDMAEGLDFTILYTTVDEDMKLFESGLKKQISSNETQKLIETKNISADEKSNQNSTNKESAENSANKENEPKITTAKTETIESKETPKTEVRNETTNATTAEVSSIFREKAHLIKQRYYELALRKWKNTTNFAEGYSIPALKNVKAPRLWQDSKTKKYYGGEDCQEWADNNHPMWDEWRRASDQFSTFVHQKWGPTNCVDISRNLSKFAKINTSRENGASNKRVAVVKADVSFEEQNGEEGGHLIDEKEVLTVMFKKVEDMSPDDEDDKDNIFSKLETDRKTDTETDVEPLVDLSTRQVCGYCEKVCFCSPGIRNKVPFVKSASINGDVDASVTPRNNLYQLGEFRNEALQSIAKLCESKLVQHSDKFSIKVVKDSYSYRAQQLVGSICETFELAEQTRAVTGNWKEPWSEEQVREILSVESMQDMFQATYSSPYEGEDRQANIEACTSNNKRKRQNSNHNSFLSKSFLENY